MARGRKIKTTHCDGEGVFRIIGKEDNKIRLACSKCGYEKLALAEKIPDTVENISADVTATIAAAINDEEKIIEAIKEVAAVVESADDNLEEVAVD